MKKNTTQDKANFDQAFLTTCEEGRFDIAITLLPNITQIDVLDPKNNYTGFMHAVNWKNYDAVSAFIKRGANVNAVFGVSPWKTTALKTIASQDFDENVANIFKLIRSEGGNIMQASSGISPLNAIYVCDNYGLMNLLLKEKVGDEIFLGHSIEQTIYLLQQGNKKGILKAFEENGIKAFVQEAMDVQPSEEYREIIIDDANSNNIINSNVELVGGNGIADTTL